MMMLKDWFRRFGADAFSTQLVRLSMPLNSLRLSQSTFLRRLAYPGSSLSNRYATASKLVMGGPLLTALSGATSTLHSG